MKYIEDIALVELGKAIGVSLIIIHDKFEDEAQGQVCWYGPSNKKAVSHLQAKPSPLVGRALKDAAQYGANTVHHLEKKKSMHPSYTANKII